MSKNRKYVEARVIEAEMQEARKAEDFVGKVEQITIDQMVRNAKANSRFGDKILTTINPLHVHIPEWQRMCDVLSAQAIGNDYNPYKWEVPKLLYIDGTLVCVDGMHRIYGAFKAKLNGVVCEIIECSLSQAIDLFLDQTNDRRKMTPTDYYRAALANGDESYVNLKAICNKYNVAVKGDSIDNQIGIFTPITDGIRSIQRNGNGLLDEIIKLITDLNWNGYADTYNGKAYTAKFIRVFHSLFAYYEGKTSDMKEILMQKCFGTEFFVENLMELTQAQAFDKLSTVVLHEMENPFRQKKTTKKSSTLAM